MVIFMPAAWAIFDDVAINGLINSIKYHEFQSIKLPSSTLLLQEHMSCIFRQEFSKLVHCGM